MKIPAPSIAASVLFSATVLAQTNQYPFQNPALPMEDRVNNIVSLMTLDEKVWFFSSRPGVPRLGIRAMGHVEGLHGLARGGPSNWGRRNPVPTTIFPQSYGLGEMWDPEILRQVAAVEGYETRYTEQGLRFHVWPRCHGDRLGTRCGSRRQPLSGRSTHHHRERKYKRGTGHLWHLR